MKLGFVSVASTMQSQEEIRKSARRVKEKLAESGFEIFATKDLATDVETAENLVEKVCSEEIDALVYFVGSGGTERSILESSKSVEAPILLLATSSNNSFAASLEVIPRLRSEGKFSEIFFEEEITPTKICKEVKKVVEVRKAVKEFKKSRIGLIGRVSPWLVSSVEDFQEVERRLGPEVIRVELSELEKKVKEVSDFEGEDVAREFLTGVQDIEEPGEEEVVQAAKIYLGLKSLAEDKELDAISLGCFDLLPVYDNTGCFALSRLNDEGIIAGCEGDLDTTLTMLIFYKLTEGPGWMANTASVDFEGNSLTLAHCTVPLDILDGPPVVRSHFESRKGVSLQGAFDTGQKVTIARLGGPSLKRIVIALGTVKRSDLGREDMCRTQVEIELDGDVKTFLENTPGNHLVFSKGDISSELRAFADDLNLSPILV